MVVIVLIAKGCGFRADCFPPRASLSPDLACCYRFAIYISYSVYEILAKITVKFNNQDELLY